MTTSLIVPEKILGNETSMHFIPVEVKHDGPANVKSYFDSTVRKQENGDLTASLRGRPIHGVDFEIPSGYTGVIFNESKKAYTEEDEREMTVTKRFKSFQYWNLDRIPSDGDRLYQAKNWIDIASALHTSINVDLKREDSVGSLKSEVSM